jgi:hypothetical protein
MTSCVQPIEKQRTPPARFARAIQTAGRPIETATKTQMESHFGHDFSRVRVHTGDAADESAREAGAAAYTFGTNIVISDTWASLPTQEARGVLAHELAHVVQQSAGESADHRRAVTTSEQDQEREAHTSAERVIRGASAGDLTPAPVAVRFLKEPYISKVNVNLTPSESVTLEWKGTPPATPGADSYTVSTGKGYGDPDDPPGTCKRGCCTDPDTQCAPPYDEPKALGSCCTPIGSEFWTGTPRKEHNGWKYWTPVEPIHTSGGRGIALHQHDEVTGEAIGHGCIRMEEENAHRIFLYSRGRSTNVTITGRAKVSCAKDRQCGTTTGSVAPEAESGASMALTRPDQEAPGSAGSVADSGTATAATSTVSGEGEI